MEEYKMNPTVNSPEEEQEICIACGICCDSTLHSSAVLNPGEKEAGTLPEKIGENYFQTEEGEFFHLPCHYFHGKCTIYNQTKPHVCSAYRCKILNNFSRGKISKAEAIKIIRDTKSQRTDILTLAQNIWNEKSASPFIQIWKRLKEYKLLENPESQNIRVKILAAKCSILNILMTKHFKSKKEFSKMISTPESSEAEV